MTTLSAEEVEIINIHLDVCSSETDKLTEWENNFIESITEQFEENRSLSFKQRETLKRIYDKVV